LFLFYIFFLVQFFRPLLLAQPALDCVHSTHTAPTWRTVAARVSPLPSPTLPPPPPWNWTLSVILPRPPPSPPPPRDAPNQQKLSSSFFSPWLTNNWTEK
jgi:hypothetical protein